MKLLLNLPDGPKIVEIEKYNSPRTKCVLDEWRLAHFQTKVQRSGHVYCGVYKEVEKIVNGKPTRPASEPVVKMKEDGQVEYTGAPMDHVETVADHAFKCMALVDALSDQYPALFEHFQTSDSEFNVDLVKECRRIFRLMLFHDGAEPFISDIADDGASDGKTKDEKELEIIAKYASKCFSNRASSAKQLVNDFVNFQHPLEKQLYPGWTPFDGRVIQVARVIDKVEAPLSALENEREGRPGDLRHKEMYYSPISERDMKYVEICGTYNPSDIWSAHFADTFHDYAGFDEALAVLHMQVTEVRGHWFHWWKRFIHERKISTFLDE